MDWFKNNITYPATIGATTALGGGLLKYLGLNMGVDANLKSIFKIFILTTTAGLLSVEVVKETRKIEN